MSITHEAIKKLESMHPLADGKVDYTSVAHVKPGSRRLTVTAVIAALLMLVAGYLAFIRLQPHVKVPFVNAVAYKAVKPDSEQSSAKTLNMEGARKTDKEVHFKRGVEQYRKGDFFKALGEFKEALRNDPGDAVLYNNVGLVYMALGDYTASKASFDSALGIKPHYAEALNNYGALLEKTDNAVAAADMYLKAIAADSEYPDAELNLAIVLEKEGRFREASAHYDRFLKLVGDDALKEAVRKKTLYLKAELLRLYLPRAGAQSDADAK